ncbi:hypothetical protein DL770_000619 [Monosporascus sp. CRB-9-2]|nr:hypothetical protein DL770_000619 [Monosporascus sp. CRB-9-2]
MASEASLCTKTFKLNNGKPLIVGARGESIAPRVDDFITKRHSIGRAGTDDETALLESIVHALKSGYRLIDTAQMYGVESIVGKAVRASGIPRSEITVVTKFWGYWHHDPAEALRISLRDLDLEYVDMFLMHWPWAQTPDGKPLRIHESPTFAETWKMMEQLVGPECRGIGVSNFTQKTLDTVLETATIIPAVNQIELHALNPNLKLVPYCQSKGIHVMSWRTVGARDDLLTHELFTNIAKAHGCSPAVVSLSWAVQRGVTVIPKSSNKSRIEENVKLVTLTEDEVTSINKAHETLGKYRLADTSTALHVEIDGKTTVQGWTPVDFGWEDEQGNWLV